MALKLKPLGDRIIIEPNEEDDSKSSGGIIIPDTAKEKPQKGKVVAAGAVELMTTEKQFRYQ